jgi:hypothetical protein
MSQTQPVVAVKPVSVAVQSTVNVAPVHSVHSGTLSVMQEHLEPIQASEPALRGVDDADKLPGKVSILTAPEFTQAAFYLWQQTSDESASARRANRFKGIVAMFEHSGEDTRKAALSLDRFKYAPKDILPNGKKCHVAMGTRESLEIAPPVVRGDYVRTVQMGQVHRAWLSGINLESYCDPDSPLGTWDQALADLVQSLKAYQTTATVEKAAGKILSNLNVAKISAKEFKTAQREAFDKAKAEIKSKEIEREKAKESPAGRADSIIAKLYRDGGADLCKAVIAELQAAELRYLAKAAKK